MNTVNHYTDFANAEKHAHNYHAIISLGHFLKEEFRRGKKHLYLNFEDLSYKDIELDPSETSRAPKAIHIEQIVTFINELSPTDKLLVHCYAGYSRSPAAVVIAKCERDSKSIWTAMNELYDARIPDKLTPEPNEIMIKEYTLYKK